MSYLIAALLVGALLCVHALHPRLRANRKKAKRLLAALTERRDPNGVKHGIRASFLLGTNPRIELRGRGDAG